MQYLRPLFLLLLLLACSPLLQAQQLTINGRITDTLNHNSMEHAAITLLHLPDSILHTYTRARADGTFTLHPDTPGQFVVLITYPGFADYVDGITFKGQPTIELGTVAMLSRTHLMTEFVLKQRIGAIRMKGDTTEYVADSFKVHDNASVEDLLKKMPGLQIHKNGGITAQGEKVEKILVDGEEFFSDDPAVVTKNLDAKAVDKVQVFDKKSDEAMFTGIEDGIKTKTINLQLKEDRKKGAFGKVELGGGTDQYFENQALVNAFKGKRQLSAFAIVANTGKIGLGWEDRDKYGGGNNMQMDEESGNMYSYYSADEDDNGSWRGTYSGEGLPTAWTGGLHYANKYDQDKHQLSGNYRYAKQNIETTGRTLTQNILPGAINNTEQYSNSFSSAERHRGDGLYEWKIDTSSNFKATVNAGYNHKISNSNYETNTRDQDGNLINNSVRTLSTTGDNQSLNSTFLYRKKFKKKGRNVLLSFNENYRDATTTSYLYARNTYFSDTTLAPDITDQRKDNKVHSLVLDGNISYTEPLSKKAFLTGSYGITANNTNAKKLSYDRTAAEYSDIPNMEYSSNYDFKVATQKAGAVVKFNFKKYNFSMGSYAYFTNFHQHDLLRDTDFSRSYTNFAPSAGFNYNFSKQQRISISYSGRTTQPTIEQIQPLTTNTDPLNKTIGNPLLKQQFNNNINFNYNNYKVLTAAYTYLGGGASFSQDDISQRVTIDDSGRRTIQYININGNYNSWLYGGVGRKIAKLDLQVNINGDINLSHNNNYINGLQNTSDNNSYSARFSLNKDWTKKDKTVASLSLEPGITYNDNKSTISTYTTSYWSSEIRASGFVELPWKLRLNTSVEVDIRERTAVFDRNNNVVRWDAYMARKFGKKNKSEVRLSVFDILNQEKGYSRTANDNYLVENSYNTIRRYGLLSFVWNFSKLPAGTPAEKEE